MSSDKSNTTQKVYATSPTEEQEEFAFPMSFAQQRLWFLDQLEPGNALYTVSITIRLTGYLQFAAFEKSVNTIVRRHEILRTAFRIVDQTPMQIIVPSLFIPLPCIDLRTVEKRKRAIIARQLAEREALYSFNLEQGPLLRTHIVCLEDSEYLFLLTMHHIISDGWSNTIFLQELKALYSAFVQEKPSPLPELTLQYADFTLWQREWLQGDTLQRYIDYWKQQLAGASPILKLPIDYPRPPVQSFVGAHRSIMLPTSLSQQLKQFSQQEGVSLFILMVTALSVFLHHLTRQKDVLLGVVTANRTSLELEKLIGFFVNTFVLRADLSEDLRFRELLSHMRDIALEAYTYQDLPFEEVVKAVQPERSRSYAPLFQVIFDLQHAPSMTETTLHGLTFGAQAFYASQTKYDLTIIVTEMGQDIRVLMEYATDLFLDASIGHMLEQFQNLLANIAAHPDCRIQVLQFSHGEEGKKRMMEKKVREGSRLKQFKKVTPKSVNLQSEEMVQMETLAPDQLLPLIITSHFDDIDIIDWTRNHRDQLEHLLLKHGALLFRGFHLSTVSTFERFAQTFCEQLFNENGEHPRESVSGNIYTPTFYPKDKKLLWHNENSFNYQWPMKIWFGCAIPPEQGGETPIVDSRKMYELLDPRIREQFERKRVMYVRNYSEGMGVSWQEIFQTSSKAVVEEKCRQSFVDFEWIGSNQLRTRAVRYGVTKHPITGEMSWFNQAQHWHVACLDATTRASLQSLFAPADMPRNCYYGDGSSIEDSIMDEICALYEQLEVSLPWQKDDVILLDNMLTAHARNPYVGERKILVAMGEMVNQDMLSYEV